MLEEIKGFQKINLESLKKYKPSFRDLFDLYSICFIDIEGVKDYLSYVLESSTQEEDLIVSILISNDEYEIKALLEKLGSSNEGSEKKINNSIWIILKWLDQTSKLPKGFDLVEICNDLVEHFNFPEIEEKMLYGSLADWNTLENNVQTYLSKNTRE